MVDDFLIHNTSPEALQHLITTFQQHYTITVDTQASKFHGMQLDWDYHAGHVTLSMPHYVTKALQCFIHPTPSKAQYAQHTWTLPYYSSNIQYAETEDTLTPLDKDGITHLQQIIGTFLFFARAIDNTLLAALGTLAAAQSRGTE